MIVNYLIIGSNFRDKDCWIRQVHAVFQFIEDICPHEVRVCEDDTSVSDQG